MFRDFLRRPALLKPTTSALPRFPQQQEVLCFHAEGDLRLFAMLGKPQGGKSPALAILSRVRKESFSQSFGQNLSSFT